ncbi:MAG TPA: hypothetical protein VMR97_07910 [Acidimicrobiales bacterium]|nr:hypothetical protein [Acidimicrobiales bacterium]
MATSAPPNVDLHDAAYNRGRAGNPMTEAMKRASEEDPSIFESWREGMSDFGQGPEVEPEPQPARTSRQPSAADIARRHREETAKGNKPRFASVPRRTSHRRSGGRSIARRAAAPYRRAASGAAVSATGLLFGALLLVLLYVLLLNGKTLASFFSGITHFLEDMVDPAVTFFSGGA